MHLWWIPAVGTAVFCCSFLFHYLRLRIGSTSLLPPPIVDEEEIKARLYWGTCSTILFFTYAVSTAISCFIMRQNRSLLSKKAWYSVLGFLAVGGVLFGFLLYNTDISGDIGRSMYEAASGGTKIDVHFVVNVSAACAEFTLVSIAVACGTICWLARGRDLARHRLCYQQFSVSLATTAIFLCAGIGHALLIYRWMVSASKPAIVDLSIPLAVAGSALFTCIFCPMYVPTYCAIRHNAYTLARAVIPDASHSELTEWLGKQGVRYSYGQAVTNLSLLSSPLVVGIVTALVA